jgi:hypothetical protein
VDSGRTEAYTPRRRTEGENWEEGIGKREGLKGRKDEGGGWKSIIS